MVSDAGGRKGYVVRKRWKAYRGMEKAGLTKGMRARIANAGKTHADRVRMAKKAAATRRARGGH